MFGYRKSKLLSTQATDNVKSFRRKKTSLIANCIHYLTNYNSPIIKQILDVSNRGLLSTSINFTDMNINNKMNNLDYLFEQSDLDKIIIKVIEYIKIEGFNFDLSDNNLIISWSDPDMDECTPLSVADILTEYNDTK